MLPVIFSFGIVTVTSFGLFSILAFLISLYAIWRLAIVYDFDKEKIIDLFILTCLVSLIGSRLTFVLIHRNEFTRITDAVSILHYPGFYFWGGFYSGVIFLILMLLRRRISFWQVTDIAIVGLIAGLSVGSFGCLLASCQYGYPATFLGVYQSGLVDPRFPIQLVIMALFALAYWWLWRQSLKFHLTGAITYRALIWLSLIIFLTDFFRADQTHTLIQIFSLSQLIAVFTFLLGLAVQTYITKRSPLTVFYSLYSTLTSSRRRQKTIDHLTSDITEIPTQLSRTQNKIFRRFNIRRTPKNL